MSNAICVQGCTLKATASDPVHFTVSSVDVKTVLSGSGKVKAGGNEAYIEKISFKVNWSATLTPAEQATMAVTPESESGDTGDISGTSEKAKSQGKSFVLDKDNETINVSFGTTVTTTGSPGPTYPGTIKVEIDDPGQDKVKVT